TTEPDRPAGLPVQHRFSQFIPGFHARRFCTLTGPDTSPVPGSIGPVRF
ncbi:hypothetical protein A2U01_0070806, partial [Trifolium medium]|nr:hypothetical protein [Trifolium medium]